MKTNSFLLLPFLIILFFTGCKKSESNTPISTPSTWTLGSDSYTAESTTSDTGPFSDPVDGTNFFIDAYANSNGDHLQAVFLDKPTVSAVYTVVDGKGASLVANKVCLVAGHIPGDLYVSTGHAGDKVNITVSGGKITASFNSVTTEEQFSHQQKMLTGNLIEP